MSNKPKFIRDLITDIRHLERLLLKYKVGIKTDSFQRIIRDVRKNNEIDYNSGVLELFFSNEEIPRHLSHQNIENLRIYFSTKLNTNYENLINDKNPFKALEFNIYAYANNKNNQNSELVYSLHFDRHIANEGDNPSSEVHPMYHFQFGGRKLKEKNIDHGQVLSFDTPRIMHHPMEFILGLDFVLSNFFPKTWDILKNENLYRAIIKKYQKHFILPYYKAITDSFHNSSNEVWASKDLYPQLVNDNI